MNLGMNPAMMAGVKPMQAAQPKFAGTNTVDVTEATFKQEVLDADTPVLVDFWAPWCGPCKTMGPILEDLAQEYDGSQGSKGKFKIAKVNVDENPNLWASIRANATQNGYNIQGIPTFMLFNNGAVIAPPIVGAKPKAAFAQLFDAVLKQLGEQG